MLSEIKNKMEESPLFENNEYLSKRQVLWVLVIIWNPVPAVAVKWVFHLEGTLILIQTELFMVLQLFQLR